MDKLLKFSEDSSLILLEFIPYPINIYIDRIKGNYRLISPHISTGQTNYTQCYKTIKLIQDSIDIDLSPLCKELTVFKDKFYINSKLVLIAQSSIKSLCFSTFAKNNFTQPYINCEYLKSTIIFQTNDKTLYYIEIYHKPFLNDASLLINLLNNPHEEKITDKVSCQILDINTTDKMYDI